MLTQARRLAPALLLFVVAVLARAVFGPQADAGAAASSALALAVWVAGAFLLDRAIVVLVWDGLVVRTIGRPVPSLLKDLGSALVYAVASAAVVAFVFGHSIAGFWATSSVVGVVLGVALRSVILDVFFGVAVNLDDAYRTHDWITVEAAGADRVTGRVVEINWRSTRIQTEEANVVVLSNSTIGRSQITNYSQPSATARFEVRVCLDYSVPSARARRVLLAAVRTAAGTGALLAEPAPDVLIDEMDATGVHYRVRFWLRPWIDLSPSAARSRVAELALEQLRQAGLTPAYPKQDVFQAPMPLRQLSGDSSEERVALLCRVALFSRLPEDGLRALATHLTVHDFAEGAVLIRQGDEGDSLFVLVEGLLEVRAVDRERGTELVLGRIAPGQFFGEMSLLAREPRAATVVALTGALAYEIGRPAIEALLEAHPGMADTLSRAAAEHRVGRERASRLSVEQKEEETAGLARQILDRMRAFFRVVLTT